MAQLVELNQVGKREDLRDFISIIDMRDKPLLGLIPKLPDQKNMLVSWQADLYATPITSGVADGLDVDSYENSASNRALIQNYGQKFRRTAMVGDLAQNVSNVAGAQAGELARAIDKKLEEISRDIEATFCSDNSGRAETDASTPYNTRGLGIWAGTTFSGTDNTQVPAAFRPSAASVQTTTAATFTEAVFITMLRSVFLNYGKRASLNLIAGTKVKQMISQYTAYSGYITPGTTGTSLAALTPTPNTAGTSRIVNMDDGTTLGYNVTHYSGDFNDVAVFPSLLLNVLTSAAPSAIQGDQGRAYLFPTEAVGMCYNRAPRVMKLPDMGGGPRALVDAICCLVVKNPLALGQNRPAADRS